MPDERRQELYQQMILEHHRKPKNFRKVEHPTHSAEGYNPLCGDHLTVFLKINPQSEIDDVAFEGDGCAISRASASMMTAALKGKKVEDAHRLFQEFHNLVIGKLNPDRDEHHLGKLAVFSGIWHYPSRVKCASLCWHAMEGALKKEKTVSTE